ncbi:MAG: hypothetical protein WCX17_04330 [Parcubacteria group bacterium]|jgi:hypothetical protein
MSVYPQQPNYSQKAPSPMDYDLQSEKQRIAESTEEIKKELLEKWQKRYANAQIFPDAILPMSSTLRDFLLSFQNTLFYNDLARKFNLNQKQRDALPQIIWQICLNKKWDQLGALIQNNLSIGLPIAEQIVASLNQNIILKARELSQQNFAGQGGLSDLKTESPENRTAKLTLNEALKQYPGIGEQLITSEHISLKNFPEPVRPSIKNWLADYTFTLGYEKHSSVERNNYVFHGSNSLHLSSADRQKLTYILSAYDTDVSITINKVLKQVMFPAVSSEPKISPVPKETSAPPTRVAQNMIPEIKAQRPELAHIQTSRPAQEPNSRTQPLQSAAIHQNSFFHNDAPSQTASMPARPAEVPAKPASVNDQKTSAANISFSSAQKLPYEKIYPVKSLPQQDATKPQPSEEKPHSFVIRPVFSQPEKKLETRPLPKNVINLKEDK